MTEDNQQTTPQQPSFLVEMSFKTVFVVMLLGAFIGALTMGASYLLEQYFVDPVFCRSADNFALCSNGGSLAYNLAVVLVGIVGAVGLVKMSIYRPLLVVIAASATLWNANMWLGMLPWYEMLAWLSVLFAATYALYAWVLRITNFVIAFFLMIVLIVAARFILQV